MDDFVKWLGVQLDEDERIARVATPGPWEWKREHGEVWQATDEGWLDYSGEYIAGPEDRATLFGPGMTPHADAVHIARHDPARVLREIDAKRQIIAKHPSINVSDLGSDCGTCVWPGTVMAAPSPCPTLRLLALPYADRPGYREEWRP